MARFLLVLLLALWVQSSQAFIISIPQKICILPLNGIEFVTCTDTQLEIDGERFTIPEGFSTDLSTVPRSLWSIFPPHAYVTFVPSIVHDYFYAHPSGFSRKEIDTLFYEMLRQNGASRTRAYLYYYAVRLFGRQYFNDYDEESD